MAVRARVSSGTGNSSPGNANLRIGTHADHDDDGHSDSMRKYVPRHASSISPTHDAVIAPFRRYVPPPASFLFSPVIPASPLVIPAQAGILTRGAISKGRTIVANYAEKSFEVRIISCLYVLKALGWIRVVCKSRRPYPD